MKMIEEFLAAQTLGVLQEFRSGRRRGRDSSAAEVRRMVTQQHRAIKKQKRTPKSALKRRQG